MEKELEMLFACYAREFESVNGVIVKIAEPPSLTKLFLGGREDLNDVIGNLRGRLLTNASLPLDGERKYILYRLDSHVPYPAHTVTEAADRDREELAELFSEMYRATEGVEPPSELPQTFAAEKRRNTAVFKEGGRAIGMARIAFRGKSYGRINTVVVSPEHRGKGVARALVGALASTLMAEGLVPTVLADASNPSANALYSSLGFTATGELYEYILTSEICENPLIMNTIS